MEIFMLRIGASVTCLHRYGASKGSVDDAI
jgi:hypothetical protein